MDYLFLSKTPLFDGISQEEIKEILPCIGAREKSYDKNEVIFRAGTCVHEVGLVESGSVNIIVNFYWGDSNIFGHVKKGSIFGENYAAVPGKELVCDVVATELTRILFLDISKLLNVCERGCPFHTRLVRNLLKISAQKNLELSGRMMHTAPKSIRERILSYLSEQAVIHDSTHFFIPFNRQQLAEYLDVDRSALSHELSKMQKDGLLTFRKNEFTLAVPLPY